VVELSDILIARDRIAGRVHRTPLLSARSLGEPAGVRLHLKAELLLAGGYQSPVTPALTRRILAWEQVCTRRGYRGYVTRPVAERAKGSANATNGGAFLWGRVRW